MLKTGSYNQYTMQQPPRLVPPSKPGVNGVSHNPLQVATMPVKASTPQSTPVKYEEFAEGLLKTVKNKTVRLGHF